jgi:hypothetical protein
MTFQQADYQLLVCSAQASGAVICYKKLILMSVVGRFVHLMF